MKALYVLPLVIALTACNLPSSRPVVPVSLNSNGPETWIDAPLDQMHLPLAPYEVVFHGTDDSAVANVELRINDQAVPVPAPQGVSQKLLTAKYVWVPSAPGKYVLQARSQNSAGKWSAEALVTVWIEGLTRTITPTVTLTPTPTPTLVAPVVGSVAIQSISTDTVYVGGSNCGPVQETIIARATAPKGIAVVVLFYRFNPASPKGFQDKAMSPMGGDLYQATLNPTSLLGGSLGADQGTLVYQVVVQQKDGDNSIRTPVQTDIALQACGGAPLLRPPVLPPPVIILRPTATPEVIK
jgi:hypothetical protein